MSTIKIHVAELEPALFKWQQKQSKIVHSRVQVLLNSHSDKANFWQWLTLNDYRKNKEHDMAWDEIYKSKAEIHRFSETLRLACSLAHDDVVTLDVEDVYRIFGECA